METQHEFYRAKDDGQAIVFVVVESGRLDVGVVQKRHQLHSDWLAANLATSCAIVTSIKVHMCTFDTSNLEIRLFHRILREHNTLNCDRKRSLETLFVLRALASDDLRKTTEASQINASRPRSKPINGEG